MYLERMSSLSTAINMLFLRTAGEANVLLMFGPSYVITRFIVGRLVAATALALAHFPLRNA